MSIFSTIYFMFVRTALHMIFGSTVYLVFLKFFKLSKWPFALFIMLPLAILMELYQHRIHVTDSPNGFIIARETGILIFIALGALAVSAAKTHLHINPELVFLTLIIVLALSLSFMERMKPAAMHWDWKHYVDIVAWTAGPILAYPFIIKLLH